MNATPSTLQWLRTAAQRISRGSGRLTLWLARRVTRRGAERMRSWGNGATAWLGQVSGFEWAFRAGCLVGLGLVARHVLLAVSGGILDRADAVATRLMWPTAIVWLVVAYRIGCDDWQPRNKQQSEPRPAASDPTADSDQEQPETAVEHAPTAPPLPSFHQLAESLARVGTPHAHIAALADDLSTTAEQVRSALDRCGVPVEPVRMRGRGSSTGVKGSSLPAPRPTHDGVVGAGQGANNDNNNAATLRTQEGSLIITDDAHNPYRHHVHHVKG